MTILTLTILMDLPTLPRLVRSVGFALNTSSRRLLPRPVLHRRGRLSECIGFVYPKFPADTSSLLYSLELLRLPMRTAAFLTMGA